MDDERPTFEHKPPKHGVIGPFGARQLAIGLVVVVVAVVLLLAVTAPLGSTDAIGVRNPQATPFIIGPAPAQGLRPATAHPSSRSPARMARPPRSPTSRASRSAWPPSAARASG